MAIKNVVIPLEVEYLQQAAKERGVSRTKLVRIMMQKIVRDQLVPNIIDDRDLVHAPQQRYRRFRDPTCKSLILTALALGFSLVSERILHPFHSGMTSVLDLDPVWGAAGAIGAILVL